MTGREEGPMRKKHEHHLFGRVVYFECIRCGKTEGVITLCRTVTTRTVCDSCQKIKQIKLHKNRYYGK